MLNKLFSRPGLAKMAGLGLAAALAVSVFQQSAPVRASDHDDGETQIKSRNLNLTDLYVFREDWQTGNVADASNLILIMNTNPRSLPRQQYFFNTQAIYSFHVSRLANRDVAATGVEDVRFDFNFGAPANNQQEIFLNLVRFSNGQEVSRETLPAGSTTPAAPLLGNSPAPAPVSNTVITASGALTVFAGLREDPFFFDVDAFFRTRALLANNTSPVSRTLPGAPGTNTNAATSIDFAKGYNVNAIVVRVPIAVLQGNNETSFDVWETISLPNVLADLQ